MIINNLIIRNIIFVIVFFFITLQLNATNIATINLTYIIEKSISYNHFLSELGKKQKKIQSILSEKEKITEKINLNIKESEFILKEEELNLLILEYNEKIQNLKNDVNFYNNFFSKNIDINKSHLFKQIISYVTELSKELNFDIVLTEDQFFMSTKNIDLSEKIIIFINKNLIELKLIDESQINQ